MNNVTEVLKKLGVVTFKFPIYETTELMETPVEDLGLSNRALNGLKRGDIHTVRQLVNRWNGIGSIRNLGINSITEIRSKFFDLAYNMATPKQREKIDQQIIELNGLEEKLYDYINGVKEMTA